MERRNFVVALGAAALASPVSAQEKQAKPPVAAPQPARKAGYKALADASSQCVVAGQDCLRRAFAQLASRDIALIDCARSSSDAVSACGALSALAATGSAFAPAFARTVADLCLACKKDCDKFAQIAECAAMSAACAACAAECGKAAG